MVKRRPPGTPQKGIQQTGFHHEPIQQAMGSIRWIERRGIVTFPYRRDMGAGQEEADVT
jgi:hypothetical protein